MIKIDLERNIYLDELFIKRCIKTCVRQFKSIRDIKEGIMCKKINRIGEKAFNNFGSEMIIKEYRKAIDIDVYFPEYDWIFKHAKYQNFQKGEIKCPYEPRYYNVGYLGEGKYKVKENGKNTDEFDTWYNMLKRCYSDKCQKTRPTYKGCCVCEEWLNYSNFKKWYDENYYEIEGQLMALDKDILVKGNKIYSPDACVFVPQNINTLFTKRNKSRGKYPIGVYKPNNSNKYQAMCNIFYNEKRQYKYLGLYNTIGEAFNAYKQFKEANIKQMADYYKDNIPNKLHEAMYNYKVEITD